MKGTLTNRGLLRVGLLLFALFLTWCFLASIMAAVLLLSAALLLAVALSGPVEALHRRKVPRLAGAGLVVVSTAALLDLGGYLLFFVFAEQALQLAFALPETLYRLGGQLAELTRSLGLPVGDISTPSLSTLAGWDRNLLYNLLYCSLLVVGGTQVTQRRVTPTAVVEALDVVKHRRPVRLPAGKAMPVEKLAL